MSIEGATDVTTIFLGVLSIAFTAWAIVVGWATRQVIKRIDHIGGSVDGIDQELKVWVVDTEHRLSKLEEWKRLMENKK